MQAFTAVSFLLYFLLQNFFMKLSIFLLSVILFSCGSGSSDLMTKLLDEQKLLKDSANNISERIGEYINKNVQDSAEIQKNQLGVVYARLIDIQVSMDSLSKMK
jgi:hypothetical protein